MQNISYVEANNLPCFGDVEVLVCGGGPAGIGAALRAARGGASTMVIEMGGCLGGVATAGMMSHWGGKSSSKILQEILVRSHEKDRGYTWVDTNEPGKINGIPHDLQMIVLEEMMQEAGVEILYYTMVCEAVMDGNRIVGVTVQNKSGRGFVRAKCVVDATGDGDVAAFLGCEFQLGDTNGATQMPTLCFTMCGIKDEGKPIEAMARKILPSIIADTEFPLIDNDFFCAMRMSEGLWGFNAGHVRSVACLDRMSISRGMAIGREKAEQYLNYLIAIIDVW